MNNDNDKNEKRKQTLKRRELKLTVQRELKQNVETKSGEDESESEN